MIEAWRAASRQWPSSRYTTRVSRDEGESLPEEKRLTSPSLRVSLDVETMLPRVVVQPELRAEQTNRSLGIFYASKTVFQTSGAVLSLIRSLERSN
jgi:hypothetical protein